MYKKISVLIIFGIMLFNLSNIEADALSDFQKELEIIKTEQKATIERLSGLDKEIAQDLYDLTVLDGKMSEYSIKVNDLQTKYNEVNTKLKEQEDSLQNSSQLYNSAEEIYAKRLRIIYENGMPSMLDILFSSKGISDFLSRMSVLNSILEYDKSLVNNMQSQKEYIDYVKKNIELQKVQLEQLKYDTEKSTQALQNAIDAKEAKRDAMESDKSKLKAKQAALEKQEQEAAKKLEQEIIKRQSVGGTFNGMFTWPVPGYTYISAHYGKYDPWNTGVLINHYGMDIAGSGISGKPIVAIQTGTVTLAKFYGGYGNCVIIDHGKNSKDGSSYRSIYGHAERLNVVDGQKVAMGQTIAFVGTTGNSTGPHLHIEIFKDNVRVNPYQYLK
jgi:murein DD-endopeptidase MepM/ murein hydrolase activator NlpD